MFLQKENPAFFVKFLQLKKLIALSDHPNEAPAVNRIAVQEVRKEKVTNIFLKNNINSIESSDSEVSKEDI
jgi:hypothetical protein